jgi:hypothetical protein
MDEATLNAAIYVFDGYALGFLAGYGLTLCMHKRLAKLKADRVDGNNGWTVDPSGLNHWHGWLELGGDVHHGAAKALGTRPAGPCWFWWSGTPAPMAPGDTVGSLVARWHTWRNESHDHAQGFVNQVVAWCFDKPKA